MPITLTKRNNSSLRASFYAAMTGLTLLAINGCDRAATTVYVDNESREPIQIELPHYAPGRSPVIPPHSRLIAFEHLFGVAHPLAVVYWDARTGRKVGTKTYVDEQVDELCSDEKVTVPYPPDHLDPPDRTPRRLDRRDNKRGHSYAQV